MPFNIKLGETDFNDRGKTWKRTEKSACSHIFLYMRSKIKKPGFTQSRAFLLDPHVFGPFDIKDRFR